MKALSEGKGGKELAKGVFHLYRWASNLTDDYEICNNSVVLDIEGVKVNK